MLSPRSYLSEEPVCALDPLLLIPRIEYAEPIFDCVQGLPLSYSLVILDMTNFHVINDVFGYEVGDSVLHQFIAAVRSELPRGSKTMRFRHGDEFLFFLPSSEVFADTLFREIRSRCEQLEYPQLSGGAERTISFRFAVVELDEPERDYQEWLRVAEARLRAVKGQGTPRLAPIDYPPAKHSMASKPENALYYANVRFRGFVGEHFKTILWVLGLAVTAVSLIASVLQIVGGSPQLYFTMLGRVLSIWTAYFWQYFFLDPRACLVWLIILALALEINYQKGQKRFRQLALERKAELAKQLRVIAEPGQLPRNHYLALMIGELGSKAREIQRRRARDIISAIDKNIKKNEAVYWISVTEIGIIMYEDKAKDESDFVRIILKKKLQIELGVSDADTFLDDTTFAMVLIKQHDELDDLELRARNALIRKRAEEKTVAAAQPIA